MKILKEVVRVGNTGGVLVPRDWVHGKAEVKLVEEPLDVKRDVLEILKPWLPEVKSILIIGSYARGEQTTRSDVDVLVVTGKTNRKIEHGKYQVIIISQGELEAQLQKNVLPLLPMIREAKPLLNADLIEPYKKAELTKKNLRWYFETTATAMEVVQAAIELDRELGNHVSDNIIYSLVLRFRSMYIVDCLINGKGWSSRGLIHLLKKLSGTSALYEAYVRSKDGVRARRVVAPEAAEKILRFLQKKIVEQKTWAETKN